MSREICNTNNSGENNLKIWALLLVALIIPVSASAGKGMGSTAPPQAQQRSAPPPRQSAPPPRQQQQQQRPMQQQRQPVQQQQRPMQQQRPANSGSNNRNVGTGTVPRSNSPNGAGNAGGGPGSNGGRVATGNVSGNGTGNHGATGNRPGNGNDNHLANGNRPGNGNDNHGANGNRPGNGNDNHGANGNRPGNGNGPGMRPVHSVTPPRREFHDVGNHHVTMDDHHRVREIHSRDVDIHRGLRTHDRVVEKHYAGDRRVVSMGPHRGFSERAYVSRGSRTYVQRSYVYGGRRYAYAYRRYDWGGRPYYRYAPGYYYHPGFYGWAYNPWASPVYYGWGPSPWSAYYGYYFTPYPVYPNASLWLTDFLLAENLKVAYDAQQQDNSNSTPVAAPGNEQVRLSPEVKQEIATEVQSQLKAEQDAAAQSGSAAPQPASNEERPPALDSTTRVFVVSTSLAVSTDDGQECELTAGDVLSRIDDAPGDDHAVQVLVTGSKQSDCQGGSKPRVQVSDLQEMHNHFREQIDAGLQTLATGGKGLPKAPDTGTTAGEVPPPQADNAEAEVQQLQKEGDQTEQQVGQTSTPGQGGQ